MIGKHRRKFQVKDDSSKRGFKELLLLLILTTQALNSWKDVRTTRRIMDFKLILSVMMLLALPFSAELADSWLKLNFHAVCFGAKNSQYGSFNVPYGGKIAGFKLVRQSGYVSCTSASVHHLSFWGCGTYAPLQNQVNVVITTSTNQIILPLSQFIQGSGAAGKWSEIPGYNSMSPEIVLPFFSPYTVSLGQQLRLWYGEDLVAYHEGDNVGRVCCDVYALYVD
ncbi:hypothetical protein ACROYT_G000876 [Oculina patagonica]